MRIAVFGAGGVGGYFGARLAAAGQDVHFIARGEHLEAIRRRGLRVLSIKGDLVLFPANATDRPSDVGAVDWVICAVKTWQLEDAIAAMHPLLGPDTTILPLQNGVEAPDRIAAAVGAGRVLGGAAWLHSEIAEPGVVRHVSVEPRVALGELDGSLTKRAENMRAALEAAGVRVEASREIRAVMWSKLLFIASFSGVGAVTRVPAGEFRELPPARALLRAAMEEVVAVAAAHGVRLADGIVDDTLRFADGLEPGTTSSLQRDVLAGRPSELEDQSGAVVRLGRQAGVPTPAHGFIYAALLPQERRARGVKG
jgi:2-dehydropantoate 2-reductase